MDIDKLYGFMFKYRKNKLWVGTEGHMQSATHLGSFLSLLISFYLLGQLDISIFNLVVSRLLACKLLLKEYQTVHAEPWRWMSNGNLTIFFFAQHISVATILAFDTAILLELLYGYCQITCKILWVILDDTHNVITICWLLF